MPEPAACVLQQSVQYLKGVGPRRIKLLQRLRIHTVRDLLYCIPRRYEDRSRFAAIRALRPGQMETVKGRVVSAATRYIPGKRSIFHIILSDDSGAITVTWFNQPYLKNVLRPGDEIIVYGKVELFRGLQITAPEYELIRPDDDEDSTIHTGRIVPIYPLTSDLSQRYVRTVARRCLDTYAEQTPEFLPADIRQRLTLPCLAAALRGVHFPEAAADIAAARRRLIFDEFFLLQLLLAGKRGQLKEQHQGPAFSVAGELCRRLRRALPFTLTNAQEQAINEIQQDVAAGKPMNRLLQGDVGSGKTIVGVWALALCVQSGWQAVFMAPTEILARQHYQAVEQLLSPLGVRALLFTGSRQKKTRQEALRQLREQEADVAIGTHALLQEDVEFGRLGLVIVDEQHKFGVMQRLRLQRKGVFPHVLVMSATPIPRTLAITVFGDLDVSSLRELPPGRAPVKTYWINEKKRADLYGFLRKKIAESHQVYVVYPVVEKSKVADLKAATKMYEHFRDDIFPDLRVGLIHGRMKDSEKQAVMGEFKAGAIDILVSTTVIEVGVDVPNASVILIEHAERFGLSQLHQLRGRVGRGRVQSYCILLSEGKNEETVKRLTAMTKTTDGFKIAEYDLLIRGPGEFFGTRQHGMPELKIGNILTDQELLLLARREAFDYWEQSRQGQDPAAAAVFAELREKFPDTKELLLAR